MNPHQDFTRSEGLDRPALPGIPELAHGNAVGNIDAYMRDFPTESAYALESGLLRTYRESARIGEPDEFGLQRCKHVRVVVEVRDGIVEPEINDTTVASPCEDPIPHWKIRNNPDYFICQSCKKIHLIHPLRR